MTVPESPFWWRSSTSYWIKTHHLRKGSDGGDNATELLVRAAQIRQGMRVLDIASGAGDPAITLAENIGPGGRVIAIDVVLKRVYEAKQNARKKGLNHLNFLQADAQTLPFFDRTFDVITCRFGAVYFPDVEKAMEEALRGLKPGGKAFLLVWGAEEQQERVMCIRQVLGKYEGEHGEVARGNFSKPGLYRFADPEPLLDILKSIGFERVKAKSRVIPEVWVGTLKEYLEIGGLLSVESHIERYSPERQEQIRNEILMEMRRYCGGEQIRFKQSVILVSGERSDERDTTPGSNPLQFRIFE